MLDRLFNGLRRPSSEPPPDLLEREQAAEQCHRAALREMQESRIAWDPRPEAVKTATLIDIKDMDSELDDQAQELREAFGRG